MIKIKNDNKVEVCFYKPKEPTIKIKGNATKITYTPSSKKFHCSVKKDEVIKDITKWKTSHKALWPVVIEIAYAKYQVYRTNQFMLNNCIDELVDHELQGWIKMHQYMIDFSYSKKDVPKDMITSIREKIIKSFKGCPEAEKLRNKLNWGIPAATLMNLTGKTSSHVTFQNLGKDIIEMIEKYFKSVKEETISQLKSFDDIDKSNIKKFSTKEYDGPVLAVYNKIQNKLKQNKIITVGFKNTTPQKIDNSLIALKVLLLITDLKNKGKDVILTYSNIFKKDKYEKWLNENHLTLDDLKDQSNETLKKFVLETADLTKKSIISKTKTGIGSGHAYLVLDALEHEGYKYIVLKNPYQITTKIDYKKSSKLPPEVKLPEQIDKAKNECMMELNHFYKKLAAIDYDK